MHDVPNRLRFAPDAILQVIDGDALLLKLQDEAVFSLNETGARVAELIAAGHALDAIIETLAVEYDQEPRALEGDIRALVRALLARGLLVPAGEEPA